MIPVFPMYAEIDQAVATIQRAADQLPHGWKLTLTFSSGGYWGFAATCDDGVAIRFDGGDDHPIVAAVREVRRHAGLDDGLSKETT